MPAGLTNTPAAELEYMSLTDFTPGIVKKGYGLIHLSEPQARTAQQVYAQEGNYVTGYTYGCYGDAEGGLRPLPRVTKQITTTPASEPSPPTDSGRQYIVDATVVSPTMIFDTGDATRRGPWKQTADVAASPEFDSEEAYAIFAWRSNTPVTNALVTSLKRWQMQGASPAANTVTLQTQSAIDGDVALYSYLANTDGRIPGGGIALTRAAKAVPATGNVLQEYVPGAPTYWTLVATWYAGTKHQRTSVYPDPTDASFPAVSNVFDSQTQQNFLGVVAHQDRLVYLPNGEPGTGNAVTDFGQFALSKLATYDSLYYSALLLPVTDTDASTGTTTYEPVRRATDHLTASADSPSGIGVFGSINAGELIAVRHANGGFAVRGAVDSPSIVKLPGMQGVHGATNYGTMTPLGWVYGSRAGIFLWNGGDQSRCISPQLDGFFWDVSDETAVGSGKRIGSRGRMGWLYPFVWVPNNYVMDSRTGGWWRTLKPEVLAEVPALTTPAFRHMHYAPTAYGRIYAFRSSVNTEETVVADVFDASYGASAFSFISQPVPMTINRQIRVREVMVTASGFAGTVTITLSPGTAAELSYTATVTNGITERHRFTTNARLTDLVVKIESDSGDPNLEAPAVHQVVLGYESVESVGQTNAS